MHGSQVIATRESTGTDAGHAVWDGDGGQAGAISEGIVPDAGHFFWYSKVRYLLTIQI